MTVEEQTNRVVGLLRSLDPSIPEDLARRALGRYVHQSDVNLIVEVFELPRSQLRRTSTDLNQPSSALARVEAVLAQIGVTAE